MITGHFYDVSNAADAVDDGAVAVVTFVAAVDGAVDVEVLDGAAVVVDVTDIDVCSCTCCCC